MKSISINYRDTNIDFIKYNDIRLFLSEYENDFDRFFYNEFSNFCDFKMDWAFLYE